MGWEMKGESKKIGRGKEKKAARVYVCACASRFAAAIGPLQSEGCLLDGK
jgi:hypothetical protein